MRRLSWITPACYVDVDLPIIQELRHRYDIYWIVSLRPSDDDTRKYVERGLGADSGLRLTFLVQTHRTRSPRNVAYLWRMLRLALKSHPDAIYTSEYGMPFGVLLYRLLMPMRRTIAACHNVSTPKGATNERIARAYTWLWLRSFRNIQTFSESQRKALETGHKGKNVLMARLMMKDYGEPVAQKPADGIVSFLMFGNIVHYKRVDLLLRAVNLLHDRGIGGFRVTIAGNCDAEVWSRDYAPLTKHPDLLDLRIGRVPNDEVADLFGGIHWFVMPYQDIAQSGAMTVAFRYNVPVLCSDIPQFDEFVADGRTGLRFRSGDTSALADAMERAIATGKSAYDSIVARQREFAEINLSKAAIVKLYADYIDKICALP